MIDRITKRSFNDKKRSIIPALLAVVMMVSLAGALFIGPAGQVSAQGLLSPMLDHGPIVVHNNTDLADLMALNDWPGDGSSANPYIFQNLEINATGASNAISIGNTSSYLIITNSHLTNASLLSIGFGEGAGIFLFNTSHVLIVNNTIGECRYGVLVRNSTSTTVYNNTSHPVQFFRTRLQRLVGKHLLRQRPHRKQRCLKHI